MKKNVLAIVSSLIATGSLVLGYSAAQANGLGKIESGEGLAIHVIIEGASAIDAKAMIMYTSSLPPAAATEMGCWTRNPLMIESATDAVIGQDRIWLEWYFDRKGVPWCKSLKLIGEPHDQDN